MARLIAAADGNFTAAIWGVCSAVAELDSETSNANVTTSNADSAAFVLEAAAVDAIALKMAGRATTPGAATLTVILRNSTTGTDVLTVTVDVADLPLCSTTNDEGGWQVFKFAGTHTPNGTDSYVIRLVASVANQVQFYRNSTANNWTRQVRTTTLASPAAGDRLIISRELTGSGAGTNRSVTMNNTASTVFGNSTGLVTTLGVNAALVISNGGTLTWGTAAATNYLLRLTGSLLINSGGTYTMGASGAEIPRDSTAILEFVLATTNDSRVEARNGSTFNVYGMSRTAGKNVVWCLLNTDEAVGQTVLGVDTDTGWLSGDQIGIASTTRTPSQSELRTLAANANASDMTVTAGLANAHAGSAADQTQAEVILLSRNVIIRSDNAARFYGWRWGQTATVNMAWALWQYCGGGSVGAETTTGSFLAEYCAYYNWASIQPLRMISGSSNNFTFRHNVGWADNTNASNFVLVSNATAISPTWVIDDIVFVRLNASTNGIDIRQMSGTFTNLRAAGCNSTGINVQDTSTTANVIGTFGNFVAHSNGSLGMTFSFPLINRRFGDLLNWRNAGGMNFNQGQFYNALLENIVSFGNGTQNATWNQIATALTIFRDCVFASEASFTTASGINLTPAGNGMLRVRFENCTFGAGGGTKTAHTGQDIFTGNTIAIFEVTLVNCTTSTTPFHNQTAINNPLPGGFVAQQRSNSDLVNTSIFLFKAGQRSYETTTFHTSSPSEKLAPNVETDNVLSSSVVRVPVDSAETPTFSVWVRKDGSYNGTFQPRLVLKANPAIGIDEDTVLDTLSVGADTWEQLSGVAPAAAANGVMEAVVEVTGTAGNAFVDDWSVA